MVPGVIECENGSFDRQWEATCETHQRVDERALAVIDSTRLLVEQSAERCEPVRRRIGQEAVVDVAAELLEHLPATATTVSCRPDTAPRPSRRRRGRASRVRPVKGRAPLPRMAQR